MQGTHKELRQSRFNFASVLSSPEQEKGQQFLNVEPSMYRNLNERRSTRVSMLIKFTYYSTSIIVVLYASKTLVLFINILKLYTFNTVKTVVYLHTS